MGQFSRHENNAIGEQVARHLGSYIIRQLTAAEAANKLRPQADCVGVPTGWGPPEVRVHFNYAKDVSNRELRVIEYAGAEFFGLVFIEKDRYRREVFIAHGLSGDASQTFWLALETFFLSGKFTVNGWYDLVDQGQALRDAWLEGGSESAILEAALIHAVTELKAAITAA